MNFFKSILLDEPDPPKPESPHEPGPDSPLREAHEDHDPNDVAQEDNAGGWSFGGLMKTLTARSESVIETYRRDLQEFSSGLKKESEIIREVASKAVKDLPASLEAGTSAAHGVFDGVLKSTAEIIKETQVFASDGEPETPEANRSLNSGRYSWFDAQLGAIQTDLSTFCEDPEDVEEYKKWKSGFELESKKLEIENLIGEDGTLEAVYKRLVPDSVDSENFWCRYFYRVDKLHVQERVRANIVKRAISVDEDDDELSWDVDDDEEEKDGNGSGRTSSVVVKEGDEIGEKGVSDGSSKPAEIVESSNDGLRVENKGDSVDVSNGDEKKNLVESTKNSSGNPSLNEKEVKYDEIVGVKSDENVKSKEIVKEKNNENVGLEKGEKSDVSVAKVEEEKDEEDMGWDEIEDIGSGDEKKLPSSVHGERPNREELRNKLNAVDDDEDLSWDIEDDDEPVKS